jgi:hypothetical protein
MAQGEPPLGSATEADPALGPGFVTLDRFDAVSRAGAEVSYLYYDTGSSTSSVTPLRISLHGQWIDPVSRFGGYAQLPISYVSISSSAGGMSRSESYQGIGDPEIGGIYVPRVSTPGFGIVFHAGLTLPMASTGLNEVISNALVSMSRLTDYYQLVPNGLSLRVGVSPLYRSGQLFARADFGMDINLSDDDSGKMGGSTADTFMRVNAAAGIDLGTSSLSVETANLYTTKSNGGPFGSSWIDTGAVAARFRAGTIEPYAAVGFPLDHDAHNVFAKYDVSVTVGASALLQ